MKTLTLKAELPPAAWASFARLAPLCSMWLPCKSLQYSGQPACSHKRWRKSCCMLYCYRFKVGLKNLQHISCRANWIIFPKHCVCFFSIAGRSACVCYMHSYLFWGPDLLCGPDALVTRCTFYYVVQMCFSFFVPCVAPVWLLAVVLHHF